MRRAAGLAAIACLGVCAASSGAAGPSSGAGISGRVVAGPTCPVEPMPPDPQCAPRPMRASLRIHPVGRRSPAEVVRSSSDGRFRVRLAPGEYLIKPLARQGSPFPRPPAPSRVRVRAGRFTHVTITYDTGIR